MGRHGVIRFGNYPVYVNHAGRWNAVRERQRSDFAAEGDRHMVDWLDDTGKQLTEITHDQHPTMATRNYEFRVHRLLMLIASTRVGRQLFDCMNPAVRHFIVPLDSAGRTLCNCGAFTFPGTPRGGGGIRIYFNPMDHGPSAKRWLGADDILFHELVHAYRQGVVGYFGQNEKPMNLYDSAEEFLALQLQNIYLGQRGSRSFYYAYRDLRRVTKDSAYQSFADDAEVLMAFRHYLERDHLAQAVARWNQPANSFNPFRDLRVLERLYFSRSNLGIRSLPAF
jgi:hypothetical protein